MGVSKVVVNTENGEETLIDLTKDTVTEETLAEVTTAHGPNGELLIGKMPITNVLYTEQTLNSEQKEQARTNIGAASSEEVNKLNEKIVQQGNTISNFSEEIADIPNNELLVQNVAQKVPYVKVAEHPIFVNSVDEMTDISKMYVLKSDGMFYSYKAHTTTTPGGTVANFTNKVPTSIDVDGSIFNGVGYVGGTRLSSSGSTKADNYITTTGYIPAKPEDIIRIAGAEFNTGGCYVCTYDSSFNFLTAINGQGNYDGGTLDNTGTYPKITLPNKSTIAYVRVSATWSSVIEGFNGATDERQKQGPCEYMIVTVNEEITYTTMEEGTTTTYSWESTGISYNQPADYEHRVIAMENELEVLLNGTF